jgi:hypothetical protein
MYTLTSKVPALIDTNGVPILYSSAEYLFGTNSATSYVLFAVAVLCCRIFSATTIFFISSAISVNKDSKKMLSTKTITIEIGNK